MDRNSLTSQMDSRSSSSSCDAGPLFCVGFYCVYFAMFFKVYVSRYNTKTLSRQIPEPLYPCGS